MTIDTPNTVRLVVFDMAGTTVYDGDAVHLQLAKALHNAGVDPTREELNAVMGLPKPIAIRQVLSHYQGEDSASDEKVDAIFRDFLRFMLDHYENSPTVKEIEGASKTFQMLQSHGIKVALDTGFSRAIVDRILDRLGWRNSGLIDTTVASDEVANGRPYPDLIYHAMTLTGIDNAQLVAKVGDTPSDLQEGTAAGCGWVIGVTGGSHTAEELAAHPHTHLIPTVAELPALLLSIPRF